MTVYQFKTFDAVGTVEEFEVDGEIIETYSDRPYNGRFVALVERPDSHERANGVELQNSTSLSEGVDPTCSGKSGDCSRSVDQPGEVCWQHRE